MRKHFHFCLLSLIFFSCSKSKQESQTLVASYTQEFSTLDPQRIDSLEQGKILGVCYHQLFQYDKKDGVHVLKADLAQTVPTIKDNARVITLTLKDNIYFTDHPVFEEGKGRKISVDDLIYSILRLADPKKASPNYWIIENKIVGLSEWRESQKQLSEADYSKLPSGIIKKDDFTVEIALRVEASQILHAFAHHALSIISREADEKLKQDFSRQPVCSNAYRFLRWREGKSLEFELNPKFLELAEMRNAAKKIIFKFYNNPQEAFIAFKKGEVDWARVPSQEYRDVVNSETRSLQSHQQSKGWLLHEFPSLNSTFVVFNLDDPRLKTLGVPFRQAFSLAIDRNKWNQSTWNGLSIHAFNPLPPGIAGYQESLLNPFHKLDLIEAKRILKASKYKAGEVITILAYQGAEVTVKFLTEALNSIDVSHKIETVSLSEFTGRLQSKKFQISFMTWEADSPDAENFFQLLYGPNAAPSPNFSNFRDAEYDRNFVKLRSTIDEPKRSKYIKELHNRFVQQMPWIPLFHDSYFYVSSNRLGRESHSLIFGEHPALSARFTETQN